MEVSNLRVMGRATQGVRLINLREGDEIAAVAYVAMNGNNTLNVDNEVNENLDSESNDEEVNE